MTEPTASDIAQQTKVSGKAWGMLAVTYFASICAPLCQFKIPPLASWLFPAFHGALDSVTFGTLMSAIALIGVVLAFPAAFIARRMGLKNVILLSVACLGVGSALGGVDANLTLLLVSRLLEGVGIGLIGVAAPSCVTIWFPERKRGLALGLWATWVPVGSVLAFNTVPMIAGAFGYQTVFFSLAGVCLVAFVLFCAVYRMPEGATGDMGIEGTFIESLKYCKNRRIWILGAVFFLFSMTTIGDAVLPEFEQYLDGAESYREFFDAIYADDDKKNTSVWAAWAKQSRKPWIDRFDAKLALTGLRIKSDGLPLEFGTGIVLAPTGSRDRICNLYVFPSNGFNTEAADFSTSVGGSFTVAGYDFKGVYGVYRYHSSVIFEEWEVEGDPVPHKG